MNMAETETVMPQPYGADPFRASPILLGLGQDRYARDNPSGSNPAPCGRTQTETGDRRGRVATLLTHEGTTSSSRWSRERYCDGASPTISVNRALNEPSEVQPTATQVSVTDVP